ncbi:MAG: hypothetical protein KC505_00700, partial [Myxococcales bacterium]|nr:hypothetical protein [Myxococcales bacterium]
WRKALQHLIQFGGFSAHNSLEIIHDGDRAFLEIHDAFLKSQDSIFVEMYIIAPDRLGYWLRDTLIDAAARGVRVTVLYDYIGSSHLNSNFISPMTHAGIRVLPFNPIWPWRRRGPLLFRDHRKIIVVDEKIAFCGGMNISCDYAGIKYGNNRYRDSIARIMGPAVKDLLAITQESIIESEFKGVGNGHIYLSSKPPLSIFDLFFERVRRLKNPPLAKERLRQNHDTLVQVLRSNTRINLMHIQKSMEESVNRAVRYCYFTTPYFLPYGSLKKAIINARRRGVDIRILTAGISDVPLMRLASHHVYQSFFNHGVRIYEMNKKTLHAKIATIDGIFSSIGSYNLDYWSARRNLEVNVSILDSQVAQGLKEQFNEDLKLSVEIDPHKFSLRSWFKKLVCYLSYILMRL